MTRGRGVSGAVSFAPNWTRYVRTEHAEMEKLLPR